MDNIFNTRTKHTDLQGQQQVKGRSAKAPFPKGTSFGSPLVHCDKDGRNVSTKPKKVEQMKEESQCN